MELEHECVNDMALYVQQPYNPLPHNGSCSRLVILFVLLYTKQDGSLWVGMTGGLSMQVKNPLVHSKLV